MIYIVIPTFNRYNLLANLVNQLLDLNKKECSIILVDESSTKLPQSLQTLFQNKIIFHLNIGDNGLFWTGCVNFGINFVKKNFEPKETDSILLLNDDIILADDFFIVLDKLLKTLNHSTAFGATVIDSQSEEIVDGGNTVNSWTAKSYNIKSEAKSFYPVDVLTGRGVIYPIKIINEVGLFRFPKFRQCGDWDYAAQVKKRGFNLLVSRELKVQLRVSETDQINQSLKFKWRDAKKIFFGIRSNFNIKYRYYLAGSITRNRLQHLSYFFCDFVRVYSNFFR